MNKPKSKKKIAFIILLCVIILLFAADWIASVCIYNSYFGRRYETYEPYALYIGDFPGLERTRYEFTSDKGDTLVGYMYSTGEAQKGIIVLAHGFGGGGHNSYMNVADLFARNGYYVFAYDATGNDESGGDSVGGLAQGVADLNSAITFVGKSGNFPDLPIGLFGHSWGGYCVSSVLSYHPEVRAVIECSGFNCSSDMFEAQGKAEAGDGIYLMMPFVKLQEQIKCGEYASATGMKGFESTDAHIMAVHSADDNVVPIGYGFDKYYEKYSADPRFTFIRLEDKGHNHIFDDMAYFKVFFEDMQKWTDSLDYDYKAEEDQQRFTDDKAEYIRQHMDREKWSHSLDKELSERFVTFYDENMQG